MDRTHFIAAAILWLVCFFVNLIFAIAISPAFAWAWNHFAVLAFDVPALSFTRAFAAVALIQLTSWAFKGAEISLKFRKE